MGDPLDGYLTGILIADKLSGIPELRDRLDACCAKCAGDDEEKDSKKKEDAGGSCPPGQHLVNPKGGKAFCRRGKKGGKGRAALAAGALAAGAVAAGAIAGKRAKANKERKAAVQSTEARRQAEVDDIFKQRAERKAERAKKRSRNRKIVAGAVLAGVAANAAREEIKKRETPEQREKREGIESRARKAVQVGAGVATTAAAAKSGIRAARSGARGAKSLQHNLRQRRRRRRDASSCPSGQHLVNPKGGKAYCRRGRKKGGGRAALAAGALLASGAIKQKQGKAEKRGILQSAKKALYTKGTPLNQAAGLALGAAVAGGSHLAAKAIFPSVEEMKQRRAEEAEELRRVAKGGSDRPIQQVSEAEYRRSRSASAQQKALPGSSDPRAYRRAQSRERKQKKRELRQQVKEAVLWNEFKETAKKRREKYRKKAEEPIRKATEEAFFGTQKRVKQVSERQYQRQQRRKRKDASSCPSGQHLVNPKGGKAYCRKARGKAAAQQAGKFGAAVARSLAASAVSGAILTAAARHKTNQVTARAKKRAKQAAAVGATVGAGVGAAAVGRSAIARSKRKREEEDLRRGLSIQSGPQWAERRVSPTRRRRDAARAYWRSRYRLRGDSLQSICDRAKLERDYALTLALIEKQDAQQCRNIRVEADRDRAGYTYRRCFSAAKKAVKATIRAGEQAGYEVKTKGLRQAGRDREKQVAQAAGKAAGKATRPITKGAERDRAARQWIKEKTGVNIGSPAGYIPSEEGVAKAVETVIEEEVPVAVAGIVGGYLGGPVGAVTASAMTRHGITKEKAERESISDANEIKKTMQREVGSETAGAVAGEIGSAVAQHAASGLTEAVGDVVGEAAASVVPIPGVKAGAKHLAKKGAEKVVGTAVGAAGGISAGLPVGIGTRQAIKKRQEQRRA